MTDYEAAFWKLKNNWHESVKHYEDRIEKLAEALRTVKEWHGYGLPPETTRMIDAALEGKDD